jgi:hypothetical protein
VWRTQVRAQTRRYPQYRWLTYDAAARDVERTNQTHPGRTWEEIVRDNAEVGRQNDTEVTARVTSVDTFLLSMASVLIGKFTSNFFRTAIELRAARCNCVPQFVSLDAAWCCDFGAPAGFNNKTGTTFIC